MADYAVVSREEAAKQQNDIRPPTPPGVVEIEKAPRGAAPGSHPAVPVESDAEALAKWQGVDLIQANQPTGGSWKENAFGRPVFIPDPRGGGARASAPSPETMLPEDRPQQPPRAEDRPRAEEKPAERRRG